MVQETVASLRMDAGAPGELSEGGFVQPSNTFRDGNNTECSFRAHLKQSVSPQPLSNCKVKVRGFLVSDVEFVADVEDHHANCFYDRKKSARCKRDGLFRGIADQRSGFWRIYDMHRDFESLPSKSASGDLDVQEELWIVREHECRNPVRFRRGYQTHLT